MPVRVTVPAVNPDPDARLLAGLRAGDEAAFVELVRRYSPALLRVARAYVPSPSIAEEVVQETWLGVVRGIDRFEGRASFKTWLFRIAVNRARTRGAREPRTLPLGDWDGGPSVDPDRFLPADHPKWPRHWALEPSEIVETAETVAHVRDAIERLPAMQRAVITLRDVHGWDGAEVCDALELSDGNQRVLLHRARSRVRADLEALA
jgi:RNA polymerase sigma-70 factor (ECF subfamily)